MSDQTPITKYLAHLKTCESHRRSGSTWSKEGGETVRMLSCTCGLDAAIAAHVEAQRPSKVLTDEVIGKLNAPVNLGNYGDLTDKERSYLPLIGEAIHEAYRAGIRYARDNGYIAAVQPQTEPVAWMYQRASTGTWHFVKTGQRRIHNEPLTPLYLAPQALVSYAMSKDYEALYDHLCNGGEALCWVDYGWAHKKGVDARMVTRPDGVRITQIGHGDMSDKRETVVRECTRLNLEWIAPAQPLSVDKVKLQNPGFWEAIERKMGEGEMVRVEILGVPGQPMETRTTNADGPVQTTTWIKSSMYR